MLLGFVSYFEKFDHYFNFLTSIYKVPRPHNDIASIRGETVRKKLNATVNIKYIYFITANIVLSCIFFIFIIIIPYYFFSTYETFNSNSDVYSFKNSKSCTPSFKSTLNVDSEVKISSNYFLLY